MPPTMSRKLIKPLAGINVLSKTCPRAPRLPLDRRRYISAYGYTQAKALVYSKYGEPKDVLKYRPDPLPNSSSKH